MTDPTGSWPQPGDRVTAVFHETEVNGLGVNGVWTSAGSAAGLDMCLELVRRDLGAAVANEVARRVVTPPHRHGGQAQYVRVVAPARPHALDVEAWARQHLDTATIGELARVAGVSVRTLYRRFRARTGRSPQDWLLDERVNAAADLLESTDMTTEAVARRVGLGTASNLRARFTDRYGVPPSEYRRTFTRVGPGRTAWSRRRPARPGRRRDERP